MIRRFHRRDRGSIPRWGTHFAESVYNCTEPFLKPVVFDLVVLILRLSYKCQKRNTRLRLDNTAKIGQTHWESYVVPNLGWSSFYYNKVKRNSHYTAVNAQEDITAHKEVLRLTIFRFYGFIKIMSDTRKEGLILLQTFLITTKSCLSLKKFLRERIEDLRLGTKIRENLCRFCLLRKDFVSKFDQVPTLNYYCYLYCFGLGRLYDWGQSQ
ncbi:hypothetical protein PHYBLDRAFT_58388 [Phycomyces blakesleeanus NRRL 1555(-)]|uniref:Uncharacterized protein n=1 Tax=Phycomyces blakesleeanus (strain ATCC 8743b / DSM 1359 / FGSC 10004 / NBRC 33097 / NRRL 1555) TaxID=763407 RepID=A0A167Q9X3_PHYB8|nr:hypothetical protein PHYBLDRAFT_58388 [Phycomyces blakesleeanus NRRL 1555(-)]OAD79339.1 hypothetical protein PHYBLDRAFT_58388 [Phycomyces blakesleeanus NRRL 1555(-)]|eukprot:XP_018297379.1 hypothetical protein PHYBLDRAFT_58388 [Phycomyces blakesleeanus NRRL 1555(-)]